MKILFVWPNKDSFGYKPIGLSLLAAIAKNLGWQVKLFDTTEIDFGFVDNTKAGERANIFKHVDRARVGHVKKKADLSVELTRTLEEYKPDCLAVSVLDDEFFIASRISEVARFVRPGLPIIWGNKYPTLNPADVIESNCADFVCVGEGLEAFPKFLKALAGGCDRHSIPNIWSLRDGCLIKNDVAPLKKCLDDLPYVNWEIFDKRHFYKPFDGKVYVSGDHMLNWGCPYKCTYCINHVYHEMYKNNYFMRRYSIKRIIAELKYLKDQYKLELFKFHDEDYLMRPLDDLRALSEAYKQEIGLPFVIETNSGSISEEKVMLLKKMNCVSASIAVETGDADLRKDLLHRAESVKDIVKAFSLLKEYGIRACSFNMLGIPYETRETYESTVELNRLANVHYPSMGFFYPFSGTKLREIAIKAGFFDPKDDRTNVYDRNKPALKFKTLKEEELIEMLSVFVFYVKLPKDYEAFIKRSELQDEIGMDLRKKLIEIYNDTVFLNNGWYNDFGMKDKFIAELLAISGNRQN